VEPREASIPLQKTERGYFITELDDVPEGTRYFFRLGDRDFPDPASHHQPLGVHGPSEVVAHHLFVWNDDQWHAPPLRELVFYELHVGTFTPTSKFEAIIERLDDLADLGINAIELMPVAQFPGNRNWGYDGVYPYAPQNSYGGPTGLKKLVNACHQHGIAVFLDVVYNHLGPEGNYLTAYGPYFSKTYNIPWGSAINFDGEWSDGVRDYFLDNIRHWHEHYHIDGLRMDAIHMMYDHSAVHILEAANRIKETVSQKSGKPFYMVAESDLNSPKVVKSLEAGGYGFDAQWLDDFHHAAYVLLDKHGKERYEDFGTPEQLVKAMKDGFVFSGEYVKFRKRKYGASSAGVPGDRFLAFQQNHDQIGNRVGGERLSVLVDFDRLLLAAGLTLLSPYVPMIFMGEEYGEEAPFFFFTSHSELALIEAVREGRKKEFASFGGDTEPRDSQEESTFIDSMLNWELRSKDKHAHVLAWHKALLALRKDHAALQNFSKSSIQASVQNQDAIVLHRQTDDGMQHLLCIFNLSEEKLAFTLPALDHGWSKILDSAEYKCPQSIQSPRDPEALGVHGPQHNRTNELPLLNAGGEAIDLLPLSVTVYKGLHEI
jgi:maltooligosyltrehalose trehalohydrolase